MKNTAHAIASFYLMIDTEMDDEEFQSKFNKDTIVKSKVLVTLPNGIIYNASFADLLNWTNNDFDENVSHVEASFYLLFDTDLNSEEFQSKFSPEIIVGSEVNITLPDGSVHRAGFADLLDMNIESFEVNEEIKKPSSCELDDQIAI